MAPLPHNNTDLLYFDYITGNEVGSQRHTVQMRLEGGLTAVDDAQGFMLELLNAISPALFRADWHIEAVRFQEAGSNFSLPITLLPLLGAFEGTATGTYEPSMEASEVTFQGRSFSSGRRVDLSLYTAVIGPGSNFRFSPTGGPLASQVSAALAVLADATLAGCFLVIDGSPATWLQYMNQNFNSYWETEVRG